MVRLYRLYQVKQTTPTRYKLPSISNLIAEIDRMDAKTDQKEWDCMSLKLDSTFDSFITLNLDGYELVKTYTNIKASLNAILLKHVSLIDDYLKKANTRHEPFYSVRFFFSDLIDALLGNNTLSPSNGNRSPVRGHSPGASDPILGSMAGMHSVGGGPQDRSGAAKREKRAWDSETHSVANSIISLDRTDVPIKKGRPN